jgi:hypothetical protein
MIAQRWPNRYDRFLDQEDRSRPDALGEESDYRHC